LREIVFVSLVLLRFCENIRIDFRADNLLNGVIANSLLSLTIFQQIGYVKTQRLAIFAFDR